MVSVCLRLLWGRSQRDGSYLLKCSCGMIRTLRDDEMSLNSKVSLDSLRISSSNNITTLLIRGQGPGPYCSVIYRLTEQEETGCDLSGWRFNLPVSFKMDEFRCKLCAIYMFIGGRLPKVLKCGHTICSFCVFYLVSEGNLSCPYCKASHRVVQAENVPYNHMAISIITSKPARALSASLNHRTEAVLNLRAQAQQPIPEATVNAGVCIEHGLPCNHYCIKCQVWICEDCTLFNHPHKTCNMATMRYCASQLMMMEGGNSGELFDKNIRLYALKKSFTMKLLRIFRKHILEVRILINECHKALRALDQERFYIISTLSDARPATLLLHEARGKLSEEWGPEAMFATCRTAIELKNVLRNWYGTVPVKGSKIALYAEELQRATAATIAIFKGFLEVFTHGRFTFNLKDKSNRPLVKQYLPSLTTLVDFKEDSDDEFTKEITEENGTPEGDEGESAASQEGASQEKDPQLLQSAL
ncbi:uncharacterized protein [Macrobrachium rosenbergii]|uniref:uncharacterized protein n=1 Tax=Macrobrachium rosenbergii TaxID=79674 RepID=UPI0034D516D5